MILLTPDEIIRSEFQYAVDGFAVDTVDVDVDVAEVGKH
jgi:hypothetical protein